VPHSTQLDKERITTSTPESEAGVLVVRRHHLLVRCSHWLNVPILLGLILTGLSIYWASPVYQHKPNPLTGNAVLCGRRHMDMCACTGAALASMAGGASGRSREYLRIL